LDKTWLPLLSDAEALTVPSNVKAVSLMVTTAASAATKSELLPFANLLGLSNVDQSSGA
jgi:hypothetical protein